MLQFYLAIGQCKEGIVFFICTEDLMPHDTLGMIIEIICHHLCLWNKHLMKSVLMALQGKEKKTSQWGN